MRLYIWIKPFRLAKSITETAIEFDQKVKSQYEFIRAQSNKISQLESTVEYLKLRQDRLFNNIIAKLYR